MQMIVIPEWMKMYIDSSCERLNLPKHKRECRFYLTAGYFPNNDAEQVWFFYQWRLDGQRFVCSNKSQISLNEFFAFRKIAYAFIDNTLEMVRDADEQDLIRNKSKDQNEGADED